MPVSAVVGMCIDGTAVAVVRRMTEDKVLRAELRVIGGDAEGVAKQRQQVILYDKHLNVNSAVAQHRITFPADTGQLSAGDFSYYSSVTTSVKSFKLICKLGYCTLLIGSHLCPVICLHCLCRCVTWYLEFSIYNLYNIKLPTVLPSMSVQDQNYERGRKFCRICKFEK